MGINKYMLVILSGRMREEVIHAWREATGGMAIGGYARAGPHIRDLRVTDGS
jgi:hypothetical protein